MKPPPFTYHAPERLEDVLALLAQHGADSRVIAGGQSLVPLMNLRMARPEILIDLNRCSDLRHIEKGESGVTYGAMVRQIDAQTSDISRKFCPLVSKALSHAGPIAVRNRATVGGTLAHADRAAELPGVAMALNATFVIASTDGEREVPAEEFFLGDMTTPIEPNEMLRAVIFPITDATAFSGFFEVGLRQEGVALVGLAAHITFRGGHVIGDARLAVIGVESAPVRLKSVEEELQGQELTAALIAQVGAQAGNAVDPVDDAQATAHYRKHVTGALLRKALDNALTGGSVGNGH